MDTRPIYTRAVAKLETAAVAATFLEPADAATIERHWIDEHLFLARDRSWQLMLRARLRPVHEDVCEEVTFSVYMFPMKRLPGDERAEMPSRAETATRRSRYALAPGCRELPGRSFATVLGGGDNRIPDAEGIAILRALAAAQAAAAGPGPLPFRLTCRSWAIGHPECPSDLRALLAALPLHQAFSIERHPFPHNCSSMGRDEGDAVEIGDPEGRDVWDVRLRHIGTDRAEIHLIRQFSRTHVLC